MLIVEVNYNGVFVPNPLKYEGGLKLTLSDVDFEEMEYPDLVEYLCRVTNLTIKNLFYSVGNRSLARSLKLLMCDIDFKQCKAEGHLHGGRIFIFVDDNDYDILDWIAEETIHLDEIDFRHDELHGSDGEHDKHDDDREYEEDEEDEEFEYEEDDDEDALLGDCPMEHEIDAENIETKRIHEDPFLNVLPANTNGERNSTSKNFPSYNPSADWKEMKPICGMCFEDKEQLRTLLTNYSVANGYDLHYVTNDKHRVIVRCGRLTKEQKGCPFRLWASWMSKERTFQIKTLDETHNCARIFHGGSLVTYKWIAKQYERQFVDNPTLSYRKMVLDIQEKFNLKVSMGQCKRAKKAALEELEGCLEDHYAKLWSYAEELRRSNPGSTFRLDVNIMPDGKNYFNRLYVCFKSVKDGWIEGCRRVINLDGCFLKGVCQGELLSAVGRDANNHIYPIAWAVCTVENKETWKWFLELLMEDIGMAIGTGNGITIISDQHKGLVEAVKELIPHAEHRQCARHIYANFLKRFKGQFFKKIFWKAAKSTTEQSFTFFMNQIKEVSVPAYEYLTEKDPKTWSQAFFQLDMACDAVENGVSESFNGALIHSRRRPIITMLEEIRLFVMERSFKMKLKGRKWEHEVCPSIMEKLDKLKKAQRFWGVHPSGFQQFEARNGHEAYSVDLEKRTCTCRGWQLTGIPCLHGVAALTYLNLNAEDYVSLWFKTDMFRNAYRYNINPLNGSAMWPMTLYIPPLPPKKRRMPGRPTIKRKRDISEREERPGKHSVTKKGIVITCSICKENGHNKKTCRKTFRNEGSSTKTGKKKQNQGARNKSKKNNANANVGVPDAGVPDAGVPVVNVGVPDAPDAGVPDTWVQSEGVPDVGVPDAGVPVVNVEGVPNINVERVENAGVPAVVDYVGQLHTTQQTIAQHAHYTSLNDHHDAVLKKLRKSERQIKLKISRPVYDKDGGGSSLEKPVQLDEA